MYKAILYQSGGCDYTIGCGVKVFELNASDMKDARNKLNKIIEKEYSDEEHKLSNCELLEVSNANNINLDNLYETIEQNKVNQEIELQRQKDEVEYQRLRKKLNYE